jgi:hypothetical protein
VAATTPLTFPGRETTAEQYPSYWQHLIINNNMTSTNRYIKIVVLVIFLLSGVRQSDAVFKEADFGHTIEVLCAELETKYKEQKSIMRRYEQNAQFPLQT